MICRCNLAYLITSVILHTVANAAIINVPADQLTIQAAINAAVNGDEIIVAPGTYTELINFNGKAITLRSSAGAGVTTIDGTGLNDSVVKCISGEGPDSVFDGFTITNGDATFGGGMLNSGARLTSTQLGTSPGRIWTLHHT